MFISPVSLSKEALSVHGLSHLLTQEDLAKRWRFKNPRTLANWRVQGVGPRFVKFGRKVFYTREEVERWEEAHIKRNTVA
jgi:hypothetical protein